MPPDLRKFKDWEPYRTNLRIDLRHGYIRKAALQMVDALPPREVRRLAAMAVTCFESTWSDRLRDLLRGVACLLGREAFEEQAR